MDGTYYSASALQRMGHIPTPKATAPGTGGLHAFSSPDGPSFKDVLDIVNPLQHIPVVNTIYRHLTGDNEGAVADVAGGALYGGPVGAALAVGDLAIKDSTGASVSEHAWAMLFGSPSSDSGTAIAKASPSDKAPPDNPPSSHAVTAPAVNTQIATTAPSANPDATMNAQDGNAQGSNAEPTVAIAAAPPATVSARQLAPQGHAEDAPPVDLLAGRGGSARSGSPQSGSPQSGSPQSGSSQSGSSQSGSYDAKSASVFAGPMPTANAKPGSEVQTQSGYMIFGPGTAPAVMAQNGPSPSASRPPINFVAYNNAGAPNTALPGDSAMPTNVTVTPAVAQAPVTITPVAATPVVQASVAASQMAASQAAVSPANVAPTAAIAAQGLAPGQRTFAPPPRNASLTPRTTAFLPTTGPGALPGHSSMALSAQNDGSNQWFASRFNQAMDKYQNAAKLGTMPVPVPAGASTSAVSPTAAADSVSGTY